MKKSLLILLFTCWALFFAAFRPVMPFAAETAAFPDGTPVTGGRILMGTIGEPSNLIPYMASDSASGEITGLLYVAPLKYDKDLNVVPWAAASYEVLEGGRLLRFVLRDDIRWEDGVPLTADDVEFTYKLMIDPKTPTAYSGDFLAIESFKKTGRLSFEVRYAKPFARSLMTWMGAILPKHVLEGQDIMTTPVARKPIGAGPYRLAKWDAGSMLTLTASDTYFEGRPNLDEVVYRIIPDPSTMFLELKAGKLDMMSLSPQQYLRQTQGPQWERDWRKYRYLSFSYTFLGFNLEHPFFKDVRVRRAISMAIDRQSLIDGVLLGQGVPTVGPYKPGTWAYNDKLTPVRQYVDEDTERTDTTGYSESVSYKFDRYKGNPVLEELVDITEEEKIGNDAVRRILTVDMTTGSAIPGSSSDPNSAGLGRICSGYVRDYAVVPNSNGDSTDCMTYSGDFKSRGKKTKLAKISVSADGQSATFEE